MHIQTVTVIGANGTMGSNVSAIFASFGSARVYMVARRIEDAEKAKKKASLSVKAEAIQKNLFARTYDDLAVCVAESDLVFESVFEDFSLKESIYKQLIPHLNKNTIIATGTSGLSIDQLSECFPKALRKNFLGIHMYNPPYNMTLCEVIPSEFTNMDLLEEVKSYLSSQLLRNVVQVKNAPAFLGNRIGFHFINMALQYAEMYRDSGGIDYIDSILGPFTGRSMAPLVTSDFVGLDVHKAIVDNLLHNTSDYAHDTFKLPSFANELINEGRLGRKKGEGLYKAITNPEGKKSILVYDIVKKSYRQKEKYGFAFANDMISYIKVGRYEEAFNQLKENNSIEARLCIRFLLEYIVYALVLSLELCDDIFAADIVMATGFSWIPPLALIDAMGGKAIVQKLIEDKYPEIGVDQATLQRVFLKVQHSNYDYRPFLKAKQ